MAIYSVPDPIMVSLDGLPFFQWTDKVHTIVSIVFRQSFFFPVFIHNPHYRIDSCPHFRRSLRAEFWFYFIRMVFLKILPYPVSQSFSGLLKFRFPIRSERNSRVKIDKLVVTISHNYFVL